MLPEMTRVVALAFWCVSCAYGSSSESTLKELLLGQAENAVCRRQIMGKICADDGPRGWDPPVPCIPTLICEDAREEMPHCKRKVRGPCRNGTGSASPATSCEVWSTSSPELSGPRALGSRVRCAMHYLHGLRKRPIRQWSDYEDATYHDLALGRESRHYKFPNVPFFWPGDDYGRDRGEGLHTETLGRQMRTTYGDELLDARGNPAVIDVLELDGTGDEWDILEGVLDDEGMFERLKRGALVRQIVLRAHLMPRPDSPALPQPTPSQRHSPYGQGKARHPTPRRVNLRSRSIARQRTRSA